MPESVRAAVEHDLQALPDELAASALAASALVLADELDDPSNSATSKSMCARALTETFEKLRALAPDEEQEQNPLDELNARRAARLAGGATA